MQFSSKHSAGALSVSHEAVYQCIYADKAAGGQLQSKRDGAL